MIVKKVPNFKKTTSKAQRIGYLSNYIRLPEARSAQEKCLYFGARGFMMEDPKSQTAEMVALSQEAVRSKDTVNHYIMSWKENEQPSPDQVEEAVGIFMDELGWKDHQAFYGLHSDTDNIHLHIVINRVHPDTVKIVEKNRGFDIVMVHKAIAKIEAAQGWQREQNARYQILENGDLGRAPYDQDKPRQLKQKKRDIENRTGEKSANRIAIEDGAAILRQAKSWEELHRELAAKGMRYEKTGSGATVFVGDIGVKASDVDRDGSLIKLQRRLGEYQPASQGQQVVLRKPEPIKADLLGWDEYIAGRNAQYADKKAAKLELDKRHGEERKALTRQQKARRDELLNGKWKGNGAALNALRSVIASEQAAEKLFLKEKHRKEREQHWQKFRPYPDFEQWQRIQGNPEMAERWRHRGSEPQHIEGDRDEKPVTRDIRDYKADLVGMQVHYSRKEDDLAADGVSFIDKGRSISVYDWRNRDTVLAALQVSAQKWGNLTLSGSDEYKALCVKLAAEHGFKITNPDLQDGIRQERQRIEQARGEARKSEQLKQFERYAQAVGAERYRVTSIKMRQNGNQQTFILDKKDGVTRGFTPQEIEQRTPEIQRLQSRGENIYYTPLSEKKHHILIDDLSQDKLDRLMGDGYKPAVILESSPGNFQAIITVGKLGSVHDKDVGNRLAEKLNREYGDTKLSGCIHPHRAPGYENRKPKHQREDGSFPEVRLIKAEVQECEKTLGLSCQLDAEYKEQTILKAQSKKTNLAPQAAQKSLPRGSALDVYQQHYRDISKRLQGGAMDLSRVDSMIAIRMRITGHKQSAIESVICQGAPSIRPTHEIRDWSEYAKRTARYAFSAAGDRRVAEFSKNRQVWEKLEGRGYGRRPERGRSLGMGF